MKDLARNGSIESQETVARPIRLHYVPLMTSWSVLVWNMSLGSPLPFGTSEDERAARNWSRLDRFCTRGVKVALLNETVVRPGTKVIYGTSGTQGRDGGTKPRAWSTAIVSRHGPKEIVDAHPRNYLSLRISSPGQRGWPDQLQSLGAGALEGIQRSRAHPRHVRDALRPATLSNFPVRTLAFFATRLVVLRQDQEGGGARSQGRRTRLLPLTRGPSRRVERRPQTRSGPPASHTDRRTPR